MSLMEIVMNPCPLVPVNNAAGLRLHLDDTRIARSLPEIAVEQLHILGAGIAFRPHWHSNFVIYMIGLVHNAQPAGHLDLAVVTMNAFTLTAWQRVILTVTSSTKSRCHRRSIDDLVMSLMEIVMNPCPLVPVNNAAGLRLHLDDTRIARSLPEIDMEHLHILGAGIAFRPQWHSIFVMDTQQGLHLRKKGIPPHVRSVL